ncbi:S-adenosylmethionine decarboxylase proenzyme [Acetobacteraceae bacterium EV16G]|uniref:S-adenosylmethionine decarboxylase proenzyme n=1 Tax=Sorlinia euscelidii TaxID=3081148 RepID=A0ABU7TZ83_9PROT
MNALAQMGMVSDFPRDNQKALTSTESGIVQKDYFIERDGEQFAGHHLLVDFWGAKNLDDPEIIEKSLRDAAVAAGATILHGHFHHFTPNGGVSGVLVLAESHISIHTWPERSFAAVDVFMCGACDPLKTLPVMQSCFKADRINDSFLRRGRVLTGV